MLEPNLICEHGHTAYSPNPEHWVTRDASGRFCTNEDCYRRQSRVRIIGQDYQYVSPFVTQPPSEVEELCEDVEELCED